MKILYVLSLANYLNDKIKNDYYSIIRIVNELVTKLNIADAKSIDITASFSNSEQENEALSAYPKNAHDTLRHRLISR